MRRKSTKRLLLFGLTLLLLMSLPTLFVESLRARVINSALPFLRSFSSKDEATLKRLESELHLMKKELATYKKGRSVHPDIVTAHVIYRNPGSWGKTLWVEFKGEGVTLNSPVIVGTALVGLIDCVKKGIARVRLITDPGLKPSVRAVRGALQNAQLADHIDALLRHLKGRCDLPLEETANDKLCHLLMPLRDRLVEDRESWYLAKGILEGGGAPLWRSRNHLLKGIGFNYDYPDQYGEARPLTSNPPILQAHDLLVTTGLDGVFPSGLRVAEVSKVFPLREGAYAYEIEALPVVKNLDSIQTVFIIPPVSDEGSFTERDGSH